MATQLELDSNGHPWFTDMSGIGRYRVMYRLLDSEDVEFLRQHGAKTWKFRRYRSWLFLRYLNALDREIESCLRKRLLHEHWDMLDVAEEKLWVRARIWKLRLSALRFALGFSSDRRGMQPVLSGLIGLAEGSAVQRSIRR